MKRYLFTLSVLSAMSLTSCNNENIDPVMTLPPVETGTANTNYQPAFQGQTRAPGAKTTTPFQSVVLTTQLSQPWGICALPDGRLLITQKSGTMKIV